MVDFETFCEVYSDVQPIERGGQKQVFSARHPEYGDVVIKLIIRIEDPRAIREIDIGTKFNITSTPAIYETGRVLYENQNTIYIVEQRIKGEDLKKMIERGVRFNLQQAVELLEQCLKFVRHLEAMGIVHRDIKPNNIMITETWEVIFLDFGIARVLNMPSLTNTESIIGPHTPGYAAPEQFNNLKDSIDSRADLFSIGVVVYESITGENPFILSARSHLEILQKTETVTPVNFMLEGDTQQQFMGLLSALMSKYPSRRPKDSLQALQWLNAAKRTFKY